MEESRVPGARRPSVAVVAGLIVAVLALAGGVVACLTSSEPAALAKPTPSRAATPFEQAAAVLDQQAAALMKGDEKGWLAAVDPGRPTLVSQYRSMFRNLRGLGVSHAEFHARPPASGVVHDKPGVVTAQLLFGYCFDEAPCPSWRAGVGDGPPKTTSQLTFKLVDGKYLINAAVDPAGMNFNGLEPAPWEGADLVLAHGERVTVAATRSQAKHVKAMVVAAEKAAVAADRFARYLGTPQRRYRIYLADQRTWKSWYGGDQPKWAIGYELPLNSTGADIVFRTSEVMAEPGGPLSIVQHEMGHVVTLAGLTHSETSDDQWLEEGIAEYVGERPGAARTAGNRNILAAAFRRGNAPRTIALPPLADDADDRTVDRLYAMGHFATKCMADQYGERRLFTFVDRVLRHGDKPDPAARAAFGRSFSTVDRSCLTWIEREVT
ncbi:hypothetical protein [Actinoplanes sp. NPDC049681]|uniref:hypothetical protein n=1 Tax=Actinoplanes sp. NPDC049681 TaxID=3363905 RepID=UPI0037928CC2